MFAVSFIQDYDAHGNADLPPKNATIYKMKLSTIKEDMVVSSKQVPLPYCTICVRS